MPTSPQLNQNQITFILAKKPSGAIKEVKNAVTGQQKNKNGGSLTSDPVIPQASVGARVLHNGER